MRYCRLCGAEWLTRVPIPEDGQDYGGPWWRCLACGGDSSEVRSYDYTPEYLTHTVRSQGLEFLIEACQANLDWVDDYRSSVPNHDFLSVGCLEGSEMVGMERRGWQSWGFDVIPGSGRDVPADRVVVEPFFQRWIWGEGRFGAVMCRETIEHVEAWRSLLKECYGVTAKKGVFQIQTVRPTPQIDSTVVYQRPHLFLFSPAFLELQLVQVGFHIVDRRLWSHGQAFLCRK